MKDITPLEGKIGIRFNNINLLKEALTHRSYLNEKSNWPVPHNERMEFLGDAVLELVVSEKLYVRYPDLPEGQLTVLRAALVNYQILGRIAGEIGMEEFILMSRGERGDNSRAKEVILANAFEALIGAIYLDQGLQSVSKFVDTVLMVHIDEIVRTKSYKDAKSALQEYVQEKYKETPKYELISEAGPAHDRIFTIGVKFDGGIVAKGSGPSKQEAEVEAAKKALERYNA